MFLKEKKINSFHDECDKYKDQITEEQRKIRHEYNNILQTIICYIEEEDIELLKDYKDSIVRNIHEINANNLIQLARVKDLNLLMMIFNMMEKAIKAGIKLNLTVFCDINQKSYWKIKKDTEFDKYFWHTYEIAAKDNNEIWLSLNLNENGFCFTLKSKINVSTDRLTCEINDSYKSSKKKKSVFYNTSIQDNYLVQEIVKLQI
jgi:hypothetical protein